MFKYIHCAFYSTKYVETVVKKIDTVYKQVKKNEIAPKMDYLAGSAGGAKSDLDKTIEKMDKLNSMNTVIRLGN